MNEKNAQCNIVKLPFSLEAVIAIMPVKQKHDALGEVAAAVAQGVGIPGVAQKDMLESTKSIIDGECIE